MLEQKVPPPPLVAVDLPTIELPTEDGIPLESAWHRDEINLLVELTRYHWRDRTDFYVGGNMFVYFSFEQVRHQDYRGPDFFIVKDVDGTQKRDAWVVWEEGGHYPDLIVELLSPSTADTDKTVKKELYEQTFHTPEYFCYDPAGQELLGWRLQGERYETLALSPESRLWSEVLGLWLGTWEGEFQGEPAVWLRFFNAEGNLVPTLAEAERQRAEAAEAEAERLRARLAELEDEAGGQEPESDE